MVYAIVQDVSKNTREKMERKHVVLSKDGMKVEVKEMQDEAYKDRTQRFVPFPFYLGLSGPFGGVELMCLVVSWLICGITLPSRIIRVGFGI